MISKPSIADPQHSIQDVKRKKKSSGLNFLRLSKNVELFSISLPALVLLLVMSYLPMFGIIIAFQNFRFDQGFFGSHWVGFDNFKFLVRSDSVYRIIRNTILYNLSYWIIGTSLALLLGILLNEMKKKWVRLYQSVMFLPYFLSWVVVGYITFAFLDHEHGYLNQMLSIFGKAPVEWYYRANVWPYILNVVYLWKSIGFATLIYFAGIIGIDAEYYEAARIDGASRFQAVWKITLPLLTPLIIIMSLLAIANMFRGDFGLHYFIPNNVGMTFSTTDIIDTYVYRALSTVGDMEMAAAAGLLQSGIGFILVLLANYTVRRINSENSLW